MNWKKVVKDKKKQPTTGEYGDWKEQIAAECYYQCVYCSIHENPWGGIDHYHVEHYRPKGLKKFAHLKNDILNLFYACPVCNRFKSDDWPADCPNDFSIASYPDPSEVDYSELIDFNDVDYTIVGKFPASRYMIERLYLNRPQLIYERREEILKSAGRRLMDDIMSLVFQLNENEYYQHALAAQQRIIKLYHDREKVRPYKLAEIRRP